MPSSMKLCCAIAVAAATVFSSSSSTTTEAFAPHQPQHHQALPTNQEELSNILKSAASINSKSNSNRNKIEKLKKKMQRPVFESALPPKKKKKFGKSNLLSPQQEMDYSYAIRTFRAAVKLREQLVHLEQDFYIHPTELEWANACGTTVADLRRIQEEGQDARAKLVAANAGLVVQQAKRFHKGLKCATEAGGGVGTILTVSDMVQEGNLGLMEAAERFEPEKGFRFSTYATYWVRQRILRSISDSSRIIRLPAHVHDMLQKIRKANSDIRVQTGREPNLTELSQYMEVPEDKLRLYTASSRNVVSLERPVSQNTFTSDSRTLGDTLASTAPTPEEDAVTDSMRRDIRQVMDTELAGPERQVLIHRFGLEECSEPASVSQTALALGMSRDRVRHIQARALNKLRHPNSNYKLKEYYYDSSSSSSSNNGYSTVTDTLEQTFRNSPSSATSGAGRKPISSRAAQPQQSPSDRIWFF